MIFTNDTAVLDIGSKSISVLIGDKNSNDIYSIRSYASVDYDGYADGAWLNPEGLSGAIAEALDTAMNAIGTRKLRKIYVGVPGEFTTVVCKEVEYSFGKPHRIVAEDLNLLFDKGDTYKNHHDYISINCSPIYYVLEQPKRLINPLGMISSTIKGMLSYILCEKSFVSFLDAILSRLNIKEVEYISEQWAEAVSLFEPDLRDKYVILVDVGYISSTVSVIRGDGLLHLASFSLGGANISADFNMVMGISFDKAEELRRKLELNLQPQDGDVYEVEYNGEIYPVPLKDIHEIVFARLDTIADYIRIGISKCDYDCPSYLPIYLTGGGISYMRGAREYLSHSIGRPIEIVAPNVPMYNKPELSTTIGLLDVATKAKNLANTSYLNRLKAKLGGLI